ncbi:MAG: hypothetical protein R3D27_02515 [Hyphomicrobiaceae bacterium]
MYKLVLAAAATMLALVAVTAPAAACPTGYKRVWIQNNPVCQLDVQASSKLKAATAPKPAKAKALSARKPKRN